MKAYTLARAAQFVDTVWPGALDIWPSNLTMSGPDGAEDDNVVLQVKMSRDQTISLFAADDGSISYGVSHMDAIMSMTERTTLGTARWISPEGVRDILAGQVG